MPSVIAPMLAAAGAAPRGSRWAYEFKYDGVRAGAYVRDSRVRLLSRNGNYVSRSYPELAELGELLPRPPGGAGRGRSYAIEYTAGIGTR
jgi:bifunctional non-homologous end joining protein LigD